MIGPDFRNSIFAHVVHALLLGGVGVYAWQAVAALVRRPRKRVPKALKEDRECGVAFGAVPDYYAAEPRAVSAHCGCDRRGVDRALVVGPNLSAREA